jgi:hypothetical protein
VSCYVTAVRERPIGFTMVAWRPLSPGST